MALRALYTAATGMTAQSVGIDVIANNLANVNTTAFKRQQVNFEDLLYQEQEQAGSTGGEESIPSGLHIGLGTKIASTNRVFTQGSMILTDRPFDLAIQGRGFFKVKLPSSIGGGSGYTRAGAFSRDQSGTLAMPGGYQLEPAITIPEDATWVSVKRDGTVMAGTPGDTGGSEVGQLQLSTFINPEGLLAHGQNLFLETEASGTATDAAAGEDGVGEIQQGALEASNVEVVKELVSMIEAQRAFEINSQVIQTSNEALQVVANLIRF